MADFEESNEGQGMDAWQGASDTGDGAAFPVGTASSESATDGIEGAFGDDIATTWLARADLFAGRFDHAGEGDASGAADDDSTYSYIDPNKPKVPPPPIIPPLKMPPPNPNLKLRPPDPSLNPKPTLPPGGLKLTPPQLKLEPLPDELDLRTPPSQPPGDYPLPPPGGNLG